MAEQVNPIVTTLTTDPKTGSGEGVVYTAQVVASGRVATTSGLKVEVQVAEPAEADFPQPPGSYVISRHEQRFVDGRAWSLQTSFYPQSLAERAPRLQNPVSIDEGTVAYRANAVSNRSATGMLLKSGTPTQIGADGLICQLMAGSKSSRSSVRPSTSIINLCG